MDLNNGAIKVWQVWLLEDSKLEVLTVLLDNHISILHKSLVVQHMNKSLT